MIPKMVKPATISPTMTAPTIIGTQLRLSFSADPAVAGGNGAESPMAEF